MSNDIIVLHVFREFNSYTMLNSLPYVLYVSMVNIQLCNLLSFTHVGKIDNRSNTTKFGITFQP